ncbi:MAG TPA: hypothetical protein ENI35_03310 [Candidatus Desulfofervidus auxilii]|uniref:Uncharacterized protein n=1 Tax=Desulfofervidus auxilii TaxID=1621989 RepID=A0A7C1VWT5_DESA2|nr:hypothetical protein [Candidatus Desulfofervidus auxilii]
MQAECLKGAKKIYSAKNKREAMKKFREWKRCWKNKAAKAVDCLEKDLEELLTFLSAPARPAGGDRQVWIVPLIIGQK